MWPFKQRLTSDKQEWSQFVAQIRKIRELEKDYKELYWFCLSVCAEADKHYKQNIWTERLLHLVMKK